MPYGTINVDKVVDTSGGVLAPISSVFRNRIINGAMVIDQRNAGASVTPISTQYSVDRFGCFLTQASKYSVQQSSVAPTGFTNSILVTSLSSYAVGSSDTFFLYQRIEGYNIADLGWGTANAQTVTLSFWVRSSLTGTFGGSLDNSAATYSYPFSYTINSANTWEQKTVTIAGQTAGVWNSINSSGIELRMNLGSGSTFSGTANTWANANIVAPTGATSVVGTNGATFYITGVQLEKGSTATSFDYRPYGTELALCQRYFETGSGVVLTVTAGRYQSFFFKVTKRAASTITNSASVTSAGDKISFWYQDSTVGSDAVMTYTSSAEL